MTAETEFSHAKIKAADYAAEIDNRYHRNRLAIARSMLSGHDLAGLTAFDFGCGEGVFMRWLSDQGAKVLGCDPHPRLISLAPEGSQKGGVEILEQQPDASIDLLVALNVLSYLSPDEIDRFWNALPRVVKPGGLFLHTGPNLPPRDRFTRVPTAEELPAFLRGIGFAELRQAYTGHQPLIWRWNMLARLAGRNLPRAGRVYNPARLALVPESILRKRAVGCYSLASRD